MLITTFARAHYENISLSTAHNTREGEAVPELRPHLPESVLSHLLSTTNSIFDNIEVLDDVKMNNVKGNIAGKPLDFKLFGTRTSSLTGRSDIKSHGRADVSKLHKVVIAVKQSNLDLLEELVQDISDPDSDNFGSIKTRDEISALTKHVESSRIILAFLKSHWQGNDRVTIEQSTFGEYISGHTNKYNSNSLYYSLVEQLMMILLCSYCSN